MALRAVDAHKVQPALSGWRLRTGLRYAERAHRECCNEPLKDHGGWLTWRVDDRADALNARDPAHRVFRYLGSIRAKRGRRDRDQDGGRSAAYRCKGYRRVAGRGEPR